ncbi:uncharacterized protein LOC123720766 [Pieris brassicae]|uniref:Uncharacterized protein n=1 Tax=Pieris brassicae TaxID=7116 RepID=A0A9P0XKD6_PIEBR|nr:uncharacterized protein LOC123720766 [Pieris brassicae]CAH4037594.1 unnamed protein product [Pieris brassicae]
MDNQYYYKLMASYLSKRNCDESFMRYFFGKNATKKTPEELERADERKRRLQRERSRRYRALKNARRQNENSRDSNENESARSKSRTLSVDEEVSDCDESPTLCDLRELNYGEAWREPASSDCASDDNSAHSVLDHTPPANLSLDLKEFLSSNTELDYPTVHSLMFHWLQT